MKFLVNEVIKYLLYSAFSVSPGVDVSLISKKWFENHYRWIVWKLSSMEVCFPDKWAGRQAN